MKVKEIDMNIISTLFIIFLFLAFLTFIGLAIFSGYRRCSRLRVVSLLFWIFGVIFIAGGIYLFPASMWRNISISLFLVGVICIIVGIFFFVKSNIERRE